MHDEIIGRQARFELLLLRVELFLGQLTRHLGRVDLVQVVTDLDGGVCDLGHDLYLELAGLCFDLSQLNQRAGGLGLRGAEADGIAHIEGHAPGWVVPA